MEKQIRVLILEELSSDADIAKRELKKVLNNPEFKVIDTEKDYVQDLKTFKPEVIVSDFMLPAYDGLFHHLTPQYQKKYIESIKRNFNTNSSLFLTVFHISDKKWTDNKPGGQYIKGYYCAYFNSASINKFFEKHFTNIEKVYSYPYREHILDLYLLSGFNGN